MNNEETHQATLGEPMFEAMQPRLTSTTIEIFLGDEGFQGPLPRKTCGLGELPLFDAMPPAQPRMQRRHSLDSLVQRDDDELAADELGSEVGELAPIAFPSLRRNTHMLPYIGDINGTNEIENIAATDAIPTLNIAPRNVPALGQNAADYVSEDMLNVDDASSDSVSANSDAPDLDPAGAKDALDEAKLVKSKSLQVSGPVQACSGLTMASSTDTSASPKKIAEPNSAGLKGRRTRKQTEKKEMKEPKKPNARQASKKQPAK